MRGAVQQHEDIARDSFVPVFFFSSRRQHTRNWRDWSSDVCSSDLERPDVFNHNVETVPRLYPLARRGSRFRRSCRVLRNAKEMGGDEVVTKSGLMTGLGETREELLDAFGVLREHGVQVLTVGQYLRPTENHLPVVRYWHPEEFADLEREAYAIGFDSVAAGPLVRSSYHAEQTLKDAKRGANVA